MFIQADAVQICGNMRSTLYTIQIYFSENGGKEGIENGHAGPLNHALGSDLINNFSQTAVYIIRFVCLSVCSFIYI